MPVAMLKILGLQWGDEGKGKIVDLLSKDYPIISTILRTGGPNTEHTIIIKGKKFVLRQKMPSGVIRDNV